MEKRKIYDKIEVKERGLSGDANSQSVHPIKDYYFHGNQAAYNKAEMMLQVGTALGGLGTLAFSPTITAGNVANYANMMEQGLDSFDVVEEVRQGAGAEDIIQYERLKAEYAADEIANAERVGSGLKEDPYHRAASFITGEQLANGRSFTFTNGDGRKMQMFQLEGMLNEINGIYEYIVNPQGEVEHQLFKPGSGIIGPR